MYIVRTIMIALGFMLAVSCGGTPPSGGASGDSTLRESETTAVTPSSDTTPPPAATTPASTPAAQGPIILEGAQNYTVAPGNTLSSISRRFYGNSEYFPLIMLGSSDVSDPDVIDRDMKLLVPNLQRNLADPGAKAKIKSYYRELADLYEKRNRPHYADQLRKFADSL